MIEFIEWFRILIENNRSLEYIIIFGIVMFGGEPALFILGFFAAQGVLPIPTVVILSFLATFPPNILWFLLGRSDALRKMITHRYADTTISLVTDAVKRVSRNNHFIELLFIKFIIGTPFILTMYISKTDFGFKRFIVYETPVIILSLCVIIPLGFVSGLGFTYFANVFNNLYVGLSFLLLVIVIIVMAQIWFKKKFTDVENKSII